MERISSIACTGMETLKQASKWSQQEATARRQRFGGSGAELRPRKRARRDVDARDALPGTKIHRPRTQPESTVIPRQDVAQITPTPLPVKYDRRDSPNGLVLDTTEIAPSAPVQTTVTFASGSISLASNQQVGVPSATAVAPSPSVVVVTASPSASAAPSSGMSTTTEAIVIACSIAGALILVTLICLLGVCYRKRKRRQLEEQVALKGMPQRMPSSSTLRSDGWQSESSEPEKQSLISSSARSRSVSPASRGPSPSGPVHTQQRSLGGYRPFMDTIPEQSQPPSPTSVYTKKSPPQPNVPGQLQLELTNVPLDNGLYSPLKPPPLRIRQGAEGNIASAVNSTLLPSPKNMFSAVRLPFMSGVSNHNRRSSAGQSLASSYDEERGLGVGMGHNRRTMESETLPAVGGPRYRDSFWSVAASSIMKNNGFKSTYGDSVYGAPGSDLRHTRTNSSSSGGHSRAVSGAMGSNGDDVGLSAIHGRARSHSSVYSARRPSEALIPALPPMPSREELEQKQSHKSGLQNQSVASVGSHASGPPGAFDLKHRLHSVDFWAREETDMRLGTFAPAELEGSSGMPTPIMEVPTPVEMPTPRDSRGMTIGAAVGGTPRHSNPYFATAAVGPQGAYSAAMQDEGEPIRESALMPQGYSHENTDDGRRLWNRGRSRDRSSDGRTSSSTVATVFKQHPGDMVMI